MKLRITHEWKEWRPKRGAYAGKVKLVCIATSPGTDNWLGQPAMIAGVNKKGTLHMHLASITHHQYMENSLPLEDKQLIKALEKKFSTYQKMWERRRLVNTAKGMLMK